MSEMFSGAAWYSGPVQRCTLVGVVAREVLDGGGCGRLRTPFGRPVVPDV